MRLPRWSIPAKLKRPLIVLAFIATAAWLFQLFILPWIVTKVVANSLASVGLDAARFNVRYVSIFRTDVDNIVLAKQTGLRIAQVSATYHPLTLLRGRVQTIELTGLQLRATIDANGIDLGPIAAFRSNGSRTGGDFPFNKILIRASSLQVNLSDRQIAVPFDGTIVCESSKPAAVDFSANLLNAPLHIKGTVDTISQHSDLSADVQNIDVSSVLALGRIYLPAGVRAGGILSAQVQFTRAPEGLALKVWSQIQEGWGRLKFGNHLILADKITFKLDTGSDQKLELKEGHLSLTCESARFDQLTTALQLDTSLHHDGADISLTLTNPAWKASVSKGQLAWTVTPASRDIDLKFKWSAAGRLAPILAEQTLHMGLDIDHLGVATLDGNVQAKLHSAVNTALSWQLKSTENHLDLQPGDVHLPAAGIDLAGLRAAANFDVIGSGERLELQVTPGARISVDDVQSRWITPRRASKATPRPPLVELVIDETATASHSTTKPSTQPWTAACKSARIKLNPCLIPLEKFAATLTGVQGELDIALTSDGTTAAATIADDSWLGFEAIDFPRGAHPISTSAFLANFTKSNGPTLQYTMADASLAAHINLHARQDQSFDIEVGPHYAKLNDLALSASIKRKPTTAPVIEAQLTCTHSTAWIDTPGLGIFDFDARIPITRNSTHKDPGLFSARATSVRDDAWPGFAGAASFSDGKFDLSLAWPLLKEAILQINANVDTTAIDGTRADVTASIPKFTLTDPNAVGRLLNSSKDIEVTGTFALDSHITLNRGILTPKIQLAIEDASFASSSYSASINGFNTNITLNSFTPLSTPGGQEIKIASANIGKLELSDGLIAFRVESPTSILIERTEWGWAGGHLYSHAVRFDPAKPDFDFVAFGDGLQVKEIAKLAAGPKADGDGAVYGRLPVSVRWPSIAFQDGYLYAAPGTGVIKLAQHADEVAKLLEKDPRFAKGAQSNLIKSRVVDSLKDFKYDLVKLDFVQHDKNLRLTVKIHGIGKVGQDNQELTLDLSFGGFDQLLEHWLVIKNMVSK